MARLHEKYGIRVRLEVIGMTDAEADWYDKVPFPIYGQESYPIFVRWIRDMRQRWAFAVAPLRKTPFNAGKSLVKYFDYSALGLPGIYSEGAPYDELRASAAPMLFAAENADSWVDALTVLIEDRSHRKELGSRAAAFVLSRHTLTAQASERRKVLGALLNLHGPVHVGTF
jgi:glycosyltransferase involved in cell wall biosynthesis